MFLISGKHLRHLTFLKRTMDWLKDSGMKVNESKTDLCLFYKGDSTPISLNLYGKTIVSNKTMNVLGVIFDSKMQWSNQVAHAIKRSTKALNAIKLIKKNFNQQELLSLVTSNFYSILNYNSEIWQLPSLKVTLKQKLLSASAKALKVCARLANNDTSFIDLHAMCKRATPIQMMRYKLALCLFKLYNSEYNSIEFSNLNFSQVLTGRQTKFKCIKDNKTKVGLNTLSNRFHTLNDLIPLNWLNMSKDTYKVHCKKLFLDYNSLLPMI